MSNLKYQQMLSDACQAVGGSAMRWKGEVFGILSLKIIFVFFLGVGWGNAAIKIDGGFDQEGRILEDSRMGDDEGLALIIQGDGKIVVAGYTSNGAVKVLTVSRYSANGAVDRGFASNGVYTLSLGTGDTIAHSLALQSDGALLVSGTAFDGRSTLVILRLTAEGHPDKAFSNDGQLLVPFSQGEIKTCSVLAGSDGAVTVAGTLKNEENGYTSFISRLNSDGRVNESFGVDGKVVGKGLDAFEIRRLAFADNDIILAGGSIILEGTPRAAMMVIHQDGSVAETYGDNGRVYIPLNGSESKINDLLVTAEGKIVTAGYVNDGTFPKAFLATFDDDGSTGAGYGAAKVFLGELNSENVANGITALQDGSILATGFASLSTGKSLIVLKEPTATEGENTDGQTQEFDSFPKPAITSVLQHSTNDNNVGNAVALAPNGQVYVAGFSENTSDRDLMLFRLAGAELAQDGAVATDDMGQSTYGYHIVTDPVTEIVRSGAVSGGKITTIETSSCADTCAGTCAGTTGTCYDTCLSACKPKPTISKRGVCFGVKKSPTYNAKDSATTDDTKTSSTTTSSTTTSSTTSTGTSTSPKSIFPKGSSPLLPNLKRTGHTEDGVGIGKFVSNITEVVPGMKYYVRAYALLSDNTVAYGNEVSFQTEDACFIATATYGSILAGQVVLLREFRDKYMISSRFGQRLVDMYYLYSPSIAASIETHHGLRIVTRIALLPIIAIALFCLKISTSLKLFVLGAACLLLIMKRFQTMRNNGK
jgi:uncharacterized delta-60 repeat protein